MAHQMPPSVNCSLDEIDLTTLKVSIGPDGTVLPSVLVSRPFCS
jgi:hypothetical protein